ncbi:MAG: hemerythrin domain-containing protein [Pseudomonadota bacterium]|nr:hemerythrin domain-containing protein [Pseudomonadota bacterium]
MRHLFTRLSVDHRRIGDILDLLELELVKRQQGDDMEMSLLQQSIGYYDEYMHRFHHPTEDVIYQHAVRIDQELQPLVDGLRVEHDRMRVATRRLLEEIDEQEVRADPSPTVLIADLRNFVYMERRHVNFEEKTVFPMLQETLEFIDWAAVERQLPDVDDPLCGDSASDRYHALSQILTSRN